MKPISEVGLDELVWAYNEATGEMGWYPVVAVWAHEDPITVYLTIDGEVIETTPEHPFFSADEEWLPAASLQVGSEVRNADWATGTVEAIEFVTESQTMYNFTVENAHTYFVGGGQWLVHNECPIDSLLTYNQWRYQVRKGNIEGYEIHHIIEKRFIGATSDSSSGRMLSTALTPDQHQAFTNAWRREFAYGQTNYETLTPNQVWEAAQKIYAEHPELLEAARKTIFGEQQ